MIDNTKNLYEKDRKFTFKKTQNNENMTRKCGSILVEGEDIEKVDQFKYLNIFNI